LERLQRSFLSISCRRIVMGSFSTKAARILFAKEDMLQNPFNQHVHP
jgi:hypothetical protein